MYFIKKLRTYYCLYPYIFFRNMESVEPMLNMVLNKPEEDTLEEVPPSPQPSPPAENTPWNTPPHVHLTDMLKKVQDVESKLSSLTLTKLDLMSFLEDITIEFKLLKHKLQLPYHGTSSQSQHLPVIAVMMTSRTWCPLMKVNLPKTMTMCQCHSDHTYHQKLSTEIY